MPDVPTENAAGPDNDDLPKSRAPGAPGINDSAEARRRRELPDNEADPEANRGESWEINEDTVGDSNRD